MVEKKGKLDGLHLFQKGRDRTGLSQRRANNYPLRQYDQHLLPAGGGLGQATIQNDGNKEPKKDRNHQKFLSKIRFHVNTRKLSK